VRVTLWLDSRRPWIELAGLASQAERAGWDGVRVGDGPGLECWAVLAALATTVPRVRLQAAAQDDVGRHPAVLAKQASTVDQLSDGRLLLGLAPGADSDGEARLAEGFHVVQCLAGTVRTSWRGEFYRLQDAPLEPKPRQQPLPLMVVGGSAPLAARCADHWSLSGSPADIGAQLVALDDACKQIDGDRRSIEVSVWSRESVLASLPDYALAGVDEWVVPDAALGPSSDGWPETFAHIRAETLGIPLR
jgi:alkanesulfonate monooxygenase SsuD/methylene tetrahydromethanopterin reductase-like flavin-dependent oxidoreductase (luciferase family)